MLSVVIGVERDVAQPHDQQKTDTYFVSYAFGAFAMGIRML